MIGYKRNEPRHNIHIFIVPLTILSIHRRKAGPLKYRRIESPFRPFSWANALAIHFKTSLEGTSSLNRSPNENKQKKFFCTLHIRVRPSFGA